MKDIRKELIKTGVRIVREKLVVASGGNISARSGNRMYIKAKATNLDSKSPKSYVEVDLSTGRVKSGVPSSELPMHTACYAARKDIGAVIHLHPVFATAVANSSAKIGPVSYELAACLGSLLVRAGYKASGSEALGKEIFRFVKKYNGVLMPNHGLIAVGPDLDTAFERAIAIERACQTLIFSKLLGVSRFLPKKEAERIIRIYRK